MATEPRHITFAEFSRHLQSVFDALAQKKNQCSSNELASFFVSRPSLGSTQGTSGLATTRSESSRDCAKARVPSPASTTNSFLQTFYPWYNSHSL